MSYRLLGKVSSILLLFFQNLLTVSNTNIFSFEVKAGYLTPKLEVNVMGDYSPLEPKATIPTTYVRSKIRNLRYTSEGRRSLRLLYYFTNISCYFIRCNGAIF